MSFMFFLPNILLSGFMFPFAGMPRWAQWVGELLPLTHYIRIVRGIMLKGATLYDLHTEALALAALMALAMTLAVRRFRADVGLANAINRTFHEMVAPRSSRAKTRVTPASTEATHAPSRDQRDGLSCLATRSL